MRATQEKRARPAAQEIGEQLRGHRDKDLAAVTLL